MKTTHKIIYSLMNFGAVAVLLIPIWIAAQFNLEWYWTAAVWFMAYCHYSELTSFLGPIERYRASKEMEFEQSNRDRSEPYFEF